MLPNKFVLAGVTASLAATLSTGIALADPVAGPDVTSKKGITVGGAIGGAGGKFAPWGGSIQLTEADAFLQSNGHCAFNVSYDIANSGTAATPNPFKNWLLAKGATVAINSALSLNAGETKQINTQPYLPQGTYELQLKMDAEGSVAESNETNNLMAVKINFDGKCGAKTPPPPPAPVPKPDLVSQRGIGIGGAVGGAGSKTAPWGSSITLTSADAFLKSNGKCAFNIIYDMANVGAAPAGPAFVNRLVSGATVVSQQSGLSLNAGKQKLVTTQAYLTPGPNVLRLQLDADNNVAESNETNNVTEIKVNVNSSCGASTEPPHPISPVAPTTTGTSQNTTRK